MGKKKNNKTLVVVESPGKVKKIQEYLGDDYVVRASFGHVRDLSTGSKGNPLGVKIENDFEPIYKMLFDKIDKVQSIIDATSACDKIYLATDNDREGESIAWHLFACLDSTGKLIKRVKFNEITKTAINKAVSNPIDLDRDLFDAQQARRVLDRIVGFLASDYLKSVGENLSAGRVQSVAAKLIIDKEREIESFIPDEYWNINSYVVKNGDAEEFLLKLNDKVTNEQDAKSFRVKLEKDDYVVDLVDAKEKKRPASPPFTTSSLQQAASAKHNMKVATTMRIAQSLYESGYITYMRTDSVRVAPEAITSVRDYLTKNNFSIPKVENNYSTNSAAQDAHEAIRPTDVTNNPSNVFLNDDEQKLYKLIWERFVSSQMEPAVYDTVSVVAKTSSGLKLKASGKSLKSDGWLAISTDQKKEASDDIVLPVLKVGDKLSLTEKKVKIEQKFTQPPQRYTEASLVKELEKRSIGRPSTYATIIETVKNRHYVDLNGKSYTATDLGKKVIDKLTKNFKFMDYDYTAEMETQLDQVAEGKLTYLKMMNDFFIPFKLECKKAQYDELKDYGIACPKCQGKTVLNHGKFGYFMSCIDKNNCKGSVSVDMVNDLPVIKETFRELEEGVSCPKCSAGMYKIQGKFGPFFTCEKYPGCNGKRKVPFGKQCSQCSNELFLTIFNGEQKLACMGYPNCKNIEDLPKKSKNEWYDPALVEKTKTSKSVKKILRVKKERVTNK